MAIRTHFGAGLIALWLTIALARADQPRDPLAGFDDYARSALAGFRTPGLAVAIVKDGNVVLARGYGSCRVSENCPVDAETIFPIASITKVFTATCLAQLVDDGRLKWSDPFVKHLPEFTLYDPVLTQEVRIDDLLSHRVGLETADLVAYRGDYDRAEILRRMRYMRPVHPFRSRFAYHNHMVTAAGEALERIGGQPWATIIRQRVLDPLGMNATLTGPRELNGRGNVSTPHILVEGRIIADPAWNREPAHEGFARLHDAVAPSGAMQSNVADMAKFLQMMLAEGTWENQSLLKPDTIRTMLAPHSTVPIKAAPNALPAAPRIFYGCGLGWQLRDLRGRKVAMHAGSTGAIVALMPEEKIGIVVLANRSSGIEFMFMHDIFARLLELPRVMTNRQWLLEAEEAPAKNAAAKLARLNAQRQLGTEPSLPLGKYAGTFACDLYGKLTIIERSGALGLQFGPNIEGQLNHWERDTFMVNLSFPIGEKWLVRFHPDGGRVDRLQIERLFWPEPMPEFLRAE